MPSFAAACRTVEDAAVPGEWRSEVSCHLRKVRKLVCQPRPQLRWSASLRRSVVEKTARVPPGPHRPFACTPIVRLRSYSLSVSPLVLYLPSRANNSTLNLAHQHSVNMRSPAVVFSLFAVSALSPSLVYGSPVPSSAAHSVSQSDHHRASSAMSARGLGFLNEVFARADFATGNTAKPAPTSKPKVASIAGVDVGYVIAFKQANYY